MRLVLSTTRLLKRLQCVFAKRECVLTTKVEDTALNPQHIIPASKSGVQLLSIIELGGNKILEHQPLVAQSVTHRLILLLKSNLCTVLLNLLNDSTS